MSFNSIIDCCEEYLLHDDAIPWVKDFVRFLQSDDDDMNETDLEQVMWLMRSASKELEKKKKRAESQKLSREKVKAAKSAGTYVKKIRVKKEKSDAIPTSTSSNCNKVFKKLLVEIGKKSDDLKTHFDINESAGPAAKVDE